MPNPFDDYLNDPRVKMNLKKPMIFFEQLYGAI